MILPRSTSIIVEWVFVAGSLVAVPVVAVAILRSAQQNTRLPVCVGRIAVALAVFLVWVAAFAFVQTHTGLGILIFRGSDHWVAKAAGVPNDEAAHILLEVIQSSNYGVDAADAAVRRLPSPREQARLFTLLASVAPSNWRVKYLLRARNAEATTVGAPRPNSR